MGRRMGSRITTSARLTAILMVLVAAGHLAPTAARGENPNLSIKLKDRRELRTPVSDELLHELEQDFVSLLQESEHAEQLLEAEDLLTRLLTDAVEGKKNSQHIYRLLDAFADAWDLPQSAYQTQGIGRSESQSVGIQHRRMGAAGNHDAPTEDTQVDQRRVFPRIRDIDVSS